MGVTANQTSGSSDTVPPSASGETLGAVELQGDDRDIRIKLLEPVNHRRSNGMGSGKSNNNRINSCSHRSIQSKGFIVAQHGCDMVTAGFKHSSAGYERASIVRDLQNVSHYWAQWAQREITTLRRHNTLFSPAALLRHSTQFLFSQRAGRQKLHRNSKTYWQ